MGKTMSNTQLGELIDVSPSMASRIRNGKRLPGRGTMVRIEEKLDFPLSKQIAAAEDGENSYAKKFNSKLRQIR